MLVITLFRHNDVRIPMIPLSQPDIDDRDRQAVMATMQSPTLSGGPFLRQFEEEFARRTGRKYALAVSSGTAALHLGVRALGLSAGDEVITTPFSFIASANCLLYESVRPVFVDVEADTYGLDPDLVAAAITPSTRAVLPVHVFGQPCKIADIGTLCQSHGLVMIEDACEALLAGTGDRLVGSFGDVAVYGFYPNKQITSGEGGMLTTDSEEIYRKVKSLRNQGRDIETDEIRQIALGYNYRMSEINAALGGSQLQRINEIKALRKQILERYNQLFAGVAGIGLPSVVGNNDPSWFLYVVRVHADVRDELIQRLAMRGIQAKAYFSPPIHLQPYYRNKFGFSEGDFPVSERLSRECLALPFYNGLSSSDQERVVEGVSKSLGEIQGM